MHACSMAQSCQTLETLQTIASQVLCPWDSPGKNTGVGFYFLLHGIYRKRNFSHPSHMCLSVRKGEWVISGWLHMTSLHYRKNEKKKKNLNTAAF